MGARFRSVAAAAVFVVVLAAMWYHTFEVTGVTAEVVPDGVERPVPPPAADLAPLPMEQADIDLFASAHPVWSAFPH